MVQSFNPSPAPAENCIDRHLADRADQAALIWEKDEPGQTEEVSGWMDGWCQTAVLIVPLLHPTKVTFQELHDEVARLANAFKSRGIGRVRLRWPGGDLATPRPLNPVSPSLPTHQSSFPPSTPPPPIPRATACACTCR